MTLVIVGLTLLGSLSPLLTFLWLFQLKEWRPDRLSEHLLQKDWQIAIGGTIPAGVIALWIVASVIINQSYLFLAVAVPAGLTGLQLISRRQRWPDWTKKAVTIAGLAVAFDLVLVTGLSHASPNLLPLLPGIQAPVVFLAWALMLPIDRHLKNNIFAAAKARRDALPHLTIIGIVGSVGKTTTKELIGAALAGKEPLVTPAHVNTELGIANWFLRETAGWTTSTTRPLVVEMGAYRRGEIALISQVIRPSIAVVTALGSDHLALFGSETAIDEANAEILSALPANGTAIFLADNARSAALRSRFVGKTILAGTETGADLRVENVTENPDTGLSFTVGQTDFRLPLSGRHNVGNAALAIAAASTLGVSDQEIAANLFTVQPLPGTFSVRVRQGLRLLDDTYNISPLSLKAALTWAGNQTERPRVLLTAGLLEVGRDEARFMRDLGEYANGRLEEAIITSKKGATAFASTFRGKTSRVGKKVPVDGLLLCVGRLPRATIESLLP